MQRFEKATYCIITAVMLLSTACSTTNSTPTDFISQENAMKRWNACVDRNTEQQPMTVFDISQLLEHSCEGHKRDVIDTFPPNLANQVDQILVSSLYRTLESNNKLSATNTQEDQLIDAVLR